MNASYATLCQWAIDHNYLFLGETEEGETDLFRIVERAYLSPSGVIVRFTCHVTADNEVGHIVHTTTEGGYPPMLY